MVTARGYGSRWEFVRAHSARDRTICWPEGVVQRQIRGLSSQSGASSSAW